MRKLLPMAAVLCLVAAGCAKESTWNTGQKAREYLTMYMDKYYPNVAPDENGLYILEEQEGDGKLWDPDSTHIYAEYTIRTLDGSISSSTDVDIAKQLGTYDSSNYYGPRFMAQGSGSSFVGVDMLLEGMREGGRRKAVIPAWLLNTSRLSSLEAYINACTTESHLVYDITYHGQTGNIEAGAVYLISYEDNGKTYILGAQDGNLGKAEWNGQTPKSVPDGFKWSPVFASNTYGWYLMNQDAEDQYLSMTGNPHKPTMYTKSGEYDYYYALKVDTDGSIWSNNYSQQFKISGENWSTVGTNSQDFTKFTFHKLVPSANEAYVITVTPNPAMVTTPPTANDLTESSSAQALVTAGTATGGTMQYALGGNADTAPATGWKEDIPTSADAGTYYVWYKAAGDDKHNDSAAACVEVTIAKRTAADPVASRGSSGGGTTTYTITVVSPDNGSAAASSKSAAKGQTVTVTPAPAEGYKLDKVTVTDKSGKEITVTENDGKYTFPMPASNVTVTPAFVKDGNVQPIPFGAEKFVDVPKDAWYHDAVYRAVDKDITQGTDETHFSPDATCTRAQMVTFLWRAAGEPEAASAENPFTDVTESAYYHDAVLWGVDQGLVKGTSETTFSPDATVTRAQTVTFLYRYEQSQGGGFTGAWAFPLDYSDASDVPLWAYEPFCWMTMHNVVQGSNGKLLSNDKCLRSQIVTMLDRYFEE